MALASNGAAYHPTVIRSDLIDLIAVAIQVGNARAARRSRDMYFAKQSNTRRLPTAEQSRLIPVSDERTAASGVRAARRVVLRKDRSDLLHRRRRTEGDVDLLFAQPSGGPLIITPVGPRRRISFGPRIEPETDSPVADDTDDDLATPRARCVAASAEQCRNPTGTGTAYISHHHIDVSDDDHNDDGDSGGGDVVVVDHLVDAARLRARASSRSDVADLSARDGIGSHRAVSVSGSAVRDSTTGSGVVDYLYV